MSRLTGAAAVVAWGTRPRHARTGATLIAPAEAAPQAFADTVALTGDGQLTTTGIPAVTAPGVALTGAGALTLAVTPRAVGPVTLTGAGALTTAVLPGVAVPVALSSTGTLGVTGVAAYGGTAALTAAGSLTGAGVPAVVAAVALTGAGALTAPAAGVAASGGPGLAGAGTLTLGVVPAFTGTQPLTGDGTLTVAQVTAPASFVAASGANGITTSGTVTLTLPAGVATGDVVVYEFTHATTGAFTIPTGWTALRNADVTVSVNYHPAIFWRVLQSGDTAPTVTTAAKWAWVGAAFRPATGNTTWAVDADTDATDLASATTITPPAGAAVGTDVSVLLTTGRAAASGATAVTSTPPTGWTEPANGDQSTAAGTTNALRQVFASVAYQMAQSGTVTPGAVTLSLASSVSATHLLIRDYSSLAYSGAVTLTGTGSLAPAGVPSPAQTLPLSAAGSLTLAPTVPAVTVTVALTATGALAPAGIPTPAGAPALTGTGSLTVAALPYRAAVAADSPSAWWRLDETTGTTFTDSAGSNPLTITGSPTLGTTSLATGDAGTAAATFANGTLQYAEHAAAATFTPTALTVEALVQSAGVNGNNRIIENGVDNSWSLYFEGAALKWTVFGKASAVYPWAGDTARHHVAGTYNGTGLAILYLDGVEVAREQGGGTGAPSVVTSALRLAGKPTSTAASDGWNGALDEVVLYPVALSPARVLAHARAAQLTPTAISWAGEVWDVANRAVFAPYVNAFSGGQVSVDGSGFLHLRVDPTGGGASVGAEISTQRAGRGYGTYMCVVGSRVDNMHPNVVLGGLFLYGADAAYGHREIDANEQSMWSGATGPATLSQSVWMPSSSTDPYAPRGGFNAAGGITTTSATSQCAVMIWEPTRVTFRLYTGTAPVAANLFRESIVNAGDTVTFNIESGGTYTGPAVIPVPLDERVHFNLWVAPNYSGTSDPATVTATDITVQSFTWAPLTQGLGTTGTLTVTRGAATGAANLTGTGSLTLAGVPRPAAGVPLTATGSLTFAVTPRPAGAVTLAATGTLTGAGAVGFAAEDFEAYPVGAWAEQTRHGPWLVEFAGGGRVEAVQDEKTLRILHLNGPEYGAPETQATSTFSNVNPGVYDTAYHYETQTSLNYIAARGWDTVKVPIRWERIQPTLNSALDTTELGRLTAFIGRCATAGLGVIVDIHNYGVYYLYNGTNGTRTGIGTTNLPTSYFADLWSRLATALNGYSNVIGYAIMAEPQNLGGLTKANWQTASQAAVDAIRAVDTTRVIHVAGWDWSITQTWATTNGNPWITDSTGRIRYEGHHYWDADTSGVYANPYATEVTSAAATYSAGTNPDALHTRVLTELRDFEAWCTSNGVKGIIGEWGWPNNADTTSWTALGSAYLSRLDAYRMDSAVWAAGQWQNDNLSVYKSTNSNQPLSLPQTQAAANEAHPSLAAGSRALRLQSAVVPSSGDTAAALVTSTALSGDVDFTVDMRTLLQLRSLRNPPTTPNLWEVAWLAWNFTRLDASTVRYYYVALKPGVAGSSGGFELGKVDQSVFTATGGQRFLWTDASTVYPVGTAWHTVRVKQTGARIQVWADGALKADFVDGPGSGGTPAWGTAGETVLTSGGIGLYEEDARVEFDSLTLGAPPAAVTLTAAGSLALAAVPASAGAAQLSTAGALSLATVPRAAGTVTLTGTGILSGGLLTYRRGVASSGGEFTPSNLPGAYDTDYHYDRPQSLTYLASRGQRTTRLAFLWERVQRTLGGVLDAGEVGRITTYLDNAATAGLGVILDVHNYGAYNSGAGPVRIGAAGGPTIAQFADLWTRLSTAFKGHSAVIGYGLMNEPNGLPDPGLTGTNRVSQTYSSWVPDDSNCTVTGTTFGADNVIKMVRNNANTFLNATSPYFTVTAGESLTISADFYPASRAGRLRIRIEYWTAAGASVVSSQFSSQPVGSLATWTNITYTSTVPAGATVAHMTVYVDDTTTVGDFAYVRNVYVAPPALSVWKQASQAAVNAIRANADTKAVLVAGDSWSGVADWTANNGSTGWITDPAGNYLYEGHHYWDVDHSGDYPDTYATEVANATGQGWTAGANPDSLTTRTLTEINNWISWLAANGAKGYVGEFGWPQGRADSTSWNTLASAWFARLDAAGLWATQWSTGEWWGTTYLLAVYVTDGTGYLAATTTASAVNEAHLQQPGGFLALTGPVTLTGSGALTGVGVPRPAGTLGFTGAGSLAAVGAPSFPAPVPLSASGALLVAGAPRTAGQLGFTGTGSLAAAGAPSFPSAVPLTATGTLTVPTRTPGVVVGLPLSTVGQLTLAVVPAASGTAGSTGVGQLLISTAGAGAGAVPLTGTGALTLAPLVGVSGTGGLTTQGALTISAAGLTAAGAVTLAAAGTLTVPARTPATVGAANLSTTGALTLAPVIGAGGAAALSATGSLVVIGSGGAGLVPLSGTGSLVLGVAALTVSAALALTGVGTLALGVTPAAGGSAALTGTGALAVAGVPAPANAVALAATGVLTPAGAPRVAAAAAFTSTGVLIAGRIVPVGFTGAGTLTLVTLAAPAPVIALAAAGVLALSALRPSALAGVTLTATGILAPAGTRVTVAGVTVALTALGALALAAIPVFLGLGALTGTGQLVVVGVAFGQVIHRPNLGRTTFDRSVTPRPRIAPPP